jgi:hypothetical protein
MKPDLLTAPPAGCSTVFSLPVMAASGGTMDLTGLVVSADGRLTIAVQGEGLTVRLDGLDCVALAMILIQLADRLAAEERAHAGADTGNALANVAPAGTA